MKETKVRYYCDICRKEIIAKEERFVPNKIYVKLQRQNNVSPLDRAPYLRAQVQLDVCDNCYNKLKDKLQNVLDRELCETRCMDDK